MNTRAIATQLIYEVLENHHSLTEPLSYFKSQCKTPKDAAFVQALAFGVLRWHPRLVFLANQLLEKPIKKKERILLYLILVGLYQLTEMQTKEHAAIAETVEAARMLNKAFGTKLINAVLRSYQRNANTLLQSVKNNEKAFYAHPRWLIERVKTAWPNDWKEILMANNAMPPLGLRVNLQKTTRDNYLTLLNSKELEAELLPFSKAGIILKTPVDVTTLPGFNEGLFSVQDGAAQFAADLLQLSPNLRVLDACAAPGGKTAQLLETEPLLKEVVAIDIAYNRTTRLSTNLKRLQLNATVITGDALHPENWWDGKPFDRILLDAPCSSTGVIRRHPDIKYLRKQNDIDKFAEQQFQLLKKVWGLLKRGGIMLYATCSILPEENTNLVEKFLNDQTDAYSLPIVLPVGIKEPLGFQILSGQNGMDGFYYAKIGKEDL